MGWGFGGTFNNKKEMYQKITLQCDVIFGKIYWLGLDFFKTNEI